MKYGITDQFKELVYNLVIMNLSNLEPCQEYLAKEIYGLEFWDDIDNYYQRSSGRIIKELISEGKLPFVFVRKQSNRSLIYRRV